MLQKIEALNALAQQRNQTLAQMAIAWLLKDTRVTSVLIGVSSISQLESCIASIKNLSFKVDELELIEKLLRN